MADGVQKEHMGNGDMLWMGDMMLQSIIDGVL
jgi:hypothetical protein